MEGFCDQDFILGNHDLLVNEFSKFDLNFLIYRNYKGLIFFNKSGS